MQVWFPLPIEEKTGVVVGKRVWLFKAVGFFGSQPPKVQILFGPTHFDRAAASGIGDGKQVKQFVVDPPGQRNDFVIGIRPFQKESGTTVVTNQVGNLFPSCQITAQVTQHRPDKMFALDGMFWGRDASRIIIDFGRERFGRIVE
jgi:hypothetical protein